jgi:hypothetical protein
LKWRLWQDATDALWVRERLQDDSSFCFGGMRKSSADLELNLTAEIFVLAAVRGEKYSISSIFNILCCRAFEAARAAVHFIQVRLSE